MERRLVILKTRVRAYRMLNRVEYLNCFFDCSRRKESVRSFISKFHKLFLLHQFIHKKNLSLTLSSLCHFLSDSYYFSMQIALSMNLSTLTSLPFPSISPWAHLWERWAFRCIFFVFVTFQSWCRAKKFITSGNISQLRGWIDKWRKWFCNIRNLRY